MDLLLDQEKKDIVLSGGDILVTSDRDSDLMQRLFLRFKTYLGEWFWNTNYGIDYLTKVFGVNKDKNMIDNLLTNEILKEPMVESVHSFSSKIQNNEYSCIFSVYLTDFTVSRDVVFLVNSAGIQLTDESNNKLYTYF